MPETEKYYCWSDDLHNARCVEQCAECKVDILNTTETKTHFTFGEVENNTPFIDFDDLKLFKMGCYGIGVNSNGSVFRKFKDTDPIKYWLK